VSATSPDKDASHQSWDEALAASVLPEPVVTVLEAAFRLLASRGGDTNVRETLTTSSTHPVLNGLATVPALRGLLRRDLAHAGGFGTGGSPSAALAAALVAADSPTAAQACRQVSDLLDQARTQQRRERRTAKRLGRPTAEQRRQERDAGLIEDARRDRDRARAQKDSAEGALNQALDLNSTLTSDLESIRSQLAVTQHQLAALRTSLTELPKAAERLRDALCVTGDAGVVRSPPDSLPVAPPEQTLLQHAAEATLTDVMPNAAIEQISVWLPDLLQAVAQPTRIQSYAELALTVDVLGGGTEVGGSCVLISAGGTRILVDCGTRPSGDDEQSMAPPGIARALAERIDAIVVTHAHNDHGGWVPVVVAKQAHVPVIATYATCDLLATMWGDSAKVLRNKTEGGQWKGGPLPPYSDLDVNSAVDQLRAVAIGREVTVGALTLELFPAGHIVGAAGVVVAAGDQRVVVTGDVSRTRQKTVSGLVLPSSAKDADLFLLESTYSGNTAADPRQKVVDDFVRQVRLTVDRSGVALVPSFALGRAQEVALICAEHLSDVEILVDGLARTVSDIYEKHVGPDRTPISIFGGNVRRVEPGKTIDEKLRLRSGVVIATSGMLNQGPAVEWAKRVLPDRNSSLMLVGYQDSESPGGALLQLADRGGGKFSLPNRDGGATQVEVLAQVEKYHLGAHANADELAAIAQDARPRKLMLVHGEREGQRRLAGRMVTRGHRVFSADRVWQPRQ
jgi:Cft2 family RNA processing exonuclease